MKLNLFIVEGSNKGRSVLCPLSLFRAVNPTLRDFKTHNGGKQKVIHSVL
jgi:hypothetical protein